MLLIIDFNNPTPLYNSALYLVAFTISATRNSDLPYLYHISLHYHISNYYLFSDN